MKFQVIGENRDSGARMTLEFEAESKAAAERKAINQNMRVHRVIDISDGVPSQSHEPNPRAGNVYRSGGGGKIKMIILLLLLAAVVWYFRGQIMWRLGMR
jgi:hypothetical protein